MSRGNCAFFQSFTLSDGFGEGLKWIELRSVRNARADVGEGLVRERDADARWVDSIHDLGLVGHIEDIAVAKDQQGKKLGLRIIQALDYVAEKVGCYKVRC